MNGKRLRRLTVSAILGAAYLACVLQWLWVLVIGLPPLIDSGAIDLLTVAPEPAPEVVQTTSEPSLLVWGLVGIITLIILIVTVVVLIRLPSTIARTGERIVHSTTEVVLPTLTHHKQLPAKKRVVLSRRIMLGIRLSLSLLPLVISLFLSTPGELTRQIIVTIAVGLAIISVIGFVLAWVIEPVATSRTRSRASRG